MRTFVATLLVTMIAVATSAPVAARDLPSDAVIKQIVEGVSTEGPQITLHADVRWVKSIIEKGQAVRAFGDPTGFVHAKHCVRIVDEELFKTLSQHFVLDTEVVQNCLPIYEGKIFEGKREGFSIWFPHVRSTSTKLVTIDGKTYVGQGVTEVKVTIINAAASGGEEFLAHTGWESQVSIALRKFEGEWEMVAGSVRSTGREMKIWGIRAGLSLETDPFSARRGQPKSPSRGSVYIPPVGTRDRR